MLALALAASAAQVDPGRVADSRHAVAVQVVDRMSGCFLSRRKDCSWTAAGDRIVSAFGALTTAQLDAIRRTILDAPQERDDLLARVGFTRSAFEANRARILDAAWPYDMPRPDPLELPPEHARLLDYDDVAPRVLDLLLGRTERSTDARHVAIEIAGDPAIRVGSTSEHPFLLPWTITVGRETRISADVEVSRALVALLDPEGPNRALLDGARYWSEEFWSERHFWQQHVGSEIEMALATGPCAQFAGYRDAVRRFRLSASVATVGHGPAMLSAQLTAREPSVIGRVSWSAHYEDGFAGTWDELLRLYDHAERAAATREWMRAWSAGRPEPAFELRVVGASTASAPDDAEAIAAWKRSGLRGEPAYELRVLSGYQTVGTLWLARRGLDAMLSTRWTTCGGRWSDAAFGPPCGPFGRTFGVVDRSGGYGSLAAAR